MKQSCSLAKAKDVNFYAKGEKDESYPKKFLEKFNLKRAEIEDNKKFIHHLPSKTLWVKILSE